MDEDSQRVLPPAFVALYIEPGRLRPSLSRADMLERHELCEDLAQMLCEPAQTQLWSLGITESDVLGKIREGLPQTGLSLTDGEMDWVCGRLAELLGWLDNAGRAPR